MPKPVLKWGFGDYVNLGSLDLSNLVPYISHLVFEILSFQASMTLRPYDLMELHREGVTVDGANLGYRCRRLYTVRLYNFQTIEFKKNPHIGAGGVQSEFIIVYTVVK